MGERSCYKGWMIYGSVCFGIEAASVAVVGYENLREGQADELKKALRLKADYRVRAILSAVVSTLRSKKGKFYAE
jgi:hypothetical protein